VRVGDEAALQAKGAARVVLRLHANGVKCRTVKEDEDDTYPRTSISHGRGSAAVDSEQGALVFILAL